MLRDRGLHFIDSHSREELAEQYRAEGWRVFVLPPSVGTKEAFFAAVNEHLPLDPSPVHRSWDALDDSLWGGLDEIQEDRAVVVWPDAAALETGDPDAFKIAVEILQALPASLADPEMTDGDPTQVVVLVSR